MEGIEQASFMIISLVGEVRSLVMESLDHARQGDFKISEKLMNQASEKFKEVHHEHFQLITQEASGNTVTINLLLVHAEDQLMSTSNFMDVAREMIKMYQLLWKKLGVNINETKDN